MTRIEISRKQSEYIREANHRWNVKMGATQSGKTYLDTRYLIPQRILERRDKEGLVFIVGVTKETVERNVLSKMRAIWGNKFVSEINSRNRAVLFGQPVYCLGAKDKSQVATFRGATVKYLYVDEFPDISEDAFDIFSSRLSMPYSCADMTGNPKDPRHWSEVFIHDDVDLYFQRYSLYDNPFLSAETIRNIERDYRGSVYFDRYVLGLPKRAEGLVFKQFADDPGLWAIKRDKIPRSFQTVCVGYDLGGNKSDFSLVATGIKAGRVYVLRSREIQAQDLRLADVEKAAREFIEGVERDYSCRVRSCYIDDNYYTTVNSLNDWRPIFGSAARVKGMMPLADRPLLLSKLMATERFYYVDGECDALVEQLQNAVYDDRADRAIILDDGSMNIDAIDAFFYSIAEDYHYLGDDR